MRAAYLSLIAIVVGCGAAQAQPLRRGVPVVEEARYFSNLPRDPATTQDVNIDRNLIGDEAPASVDVYALTEDDRQDDPVVSIERRVVYVTPRAWRGHRGGPALRVRG